MITQLQAKQIAEAEWGKGGTDYCKTNTPGAYYFSCSGHGGYVVSEDAMPKNFNRADIIARLIQDGKFSNEDYASDNPQWCYEVDVIYINGKNAGMVWRKSRRFKVPIGAKVEKRTEKVFLFEEDCEYQIIEAAGIKRND